MKRLLPFTTLLLTLSILLSSCVKEQICVNRLAKEKWEITEVRIDDIVLTDTSSSNFDFTWDFTKYSTVDENQGTFEQTINNGTVAVASDYEYEITQGCEDFIFNEEGDDEKIVADILELTKNTFTIEYTENSQTYRLTFNRM